LKKRSISIIIGLMGFALLGVVTMQIYFLTETYHQQSELFKHDVKEALSVVADKLSRQDANNFIKSKFQPENATSATDNQAQILEISGREDIGTKSFINPDSARKQQQRKRRLALLRDSLNHMLQRQQMAALTDNLQLKFEEYTDQFGNTFTQLTPQLKSPNQKPVDTQLKQPKWIITHVTYADPQLGVQQITQKVINPLWIREHARQLEAKQVNQLRHILQSDSMQHAFPGRQTAMENVIDEYRRSDESLRTRIGAMSNYIDTLIKAELQNHGIPLDFDDEILTANHDSVIYSKASLSNPKKAFLPPNTYETQIFKDVVNDPGLIRVSFPDKTSMILNRMTGPMVTTAGLVLLLIFCFGFTIFSIIRQKKISEMKTDFINNMTHEFKTPVSTIMIASDALRDSEVVNDKSRITRLANIIYEENVRLGSHIERVLNIARIDNNDFKLEKKPLDINEMISLVVDSMELKLKKRDAVVNLNLDANNAIISADELHFSNVLYNLIDNAIKYSKEQPEITISTQNKNGHVIIRVSDKGIGMSRDQQTKIFEQFYRIPTGNLHDVKGFGLGLSYVNTIVKRLNGTIGVRSEKDKGSEFELKFATA